MKTQNMILRAAAVMGLAIGLMMTTTILNEDSFAQPLKSGVDDLWSEGTGFQETELRRAVSPGFYDLSFRVWRNGVLEPVSSLPVGGGPLVLFAHVEDIDHNPAQSGTVTFEYCGNYEPKETCDAGLASWHRLNRMSIGSCYCPSCGGLPDFDPGPGNACLFVFGTGGAGMEGDDGFRFGYAGRKSGIESGMSGAANFNWTAAL